MIGVPRARNPVSFQDVTVIDGQEMRTGNVYRSAALGRVQGGLMMRFGDDVFRPLVRLGLGLQGAEQSAEMAGADGVRTEGPEVPFELDGFWLIGTGLDLVLSNRFTLGMAGAYQSLVKGQSRALEFGFHLSYGWKP